MEFATLRAAQNIVILPYYSTLHIQMSNAIESTKKWKKKVCFCQLTLIFCGEFR